MEDEQWKFDDVAKYSYTKLSVAEEFAKRLKQHLPEVTTIYDACACVGGNAIGFSKGGFNVYATEINTARYEMLKENIKVSQASNIRHRLDDCFNLFSKIEADLVFIDAPWESGKDYKQLKKFNLNSLIFDNRMSIQHAFNLIKLNKRVKYIVLKVPLKFYEDGFKADYWWNFHNHKYCLIKI